VIYKVNVLDPNPDPLGSAFIWLSWIRIRILKTKIDGNLQINQVFCHSERLWTLWTITYFKYIFHVKIQLFATSRPDQDPHWFGFLDLQHYIKSFLATIPLKVVTNENSSGCGRWLTIGIWFALWWSTFFYILIWPPSWINSVSFSAHSSQLNRQRLTK
jgi:hypothetical protein